MSVTEQTPINTYTANGATTVFAYSFLALLASDLVVQVTDTSGNVSIKTLGVDYTVSGVSSSFGGAISFLVAPTSGSVVTVFRRSDISRATDYQENGDLPASTLNADLDRIWLAIQELAAGLQQSPTNIRAPYGERLSTLLTASARAGLLLGFDENGDVSLAAPVSGSAADLAANLGSTAAGKGAGLSGFSAVSTYADLTVGKKLQEFKSAYDFGARGVSTVVDAAAINLGIATLHAAGGGYLIVNEFISTGIDLTNLTNQADVVLLDRRYCSAGHVAAFAIGSDVEMRIHGTSISGGEGPSFVAVNNATSGDRTASFVARYGSGAGAAVTAFIHFGWWTGSTWKKVVDFITEHSDGFRSNLRIKGGATIINPSGIGKSLDPDLAVSQGYSLVVNKRADAGGGYQFGVKDGAVEVPQELQITGANAAIRLQNVSGANRFSIICDFPSAGQMQVYDHVAGAALLTFTSGGALSLSQKGLSFVATAAAGVPTDTLFKDSADGKLKFKDAGGTVNALY